MTNCVSMALCVTHESGKRHSLPAAPVDDPLAVPPRRRKRFLYAAGCGSGGLTTHLPEAVRVIMIKDLDAIVGGLRDG
jgi:hypothetical protein